MPNNKEKKILFIGDIVGKPGRNAVKKLLETIKMDEKIDYVLANGENIASGKGATYKIIKEMKIIGIDYFTSGNHIWNNKDILPHMERGDVEILRPLNYSNDSAGKGFVVLDQILVINLQGRVFMNEEVSDPFTSALKVIEENQDKIIIVDIHAEATSEKIALAYYLDGKVSAVLGTHTHVQTADERILSKGTAYITDVGMTGPIDSVLGIKKEIIIEKFLTQMPQSHKVASGDAIFNAVLVTVDLDTKAALKIKRINKLVTC